jgi:hypothetical protein
MLTRNYEDLVVDEKLNVVKKKLIDFQRKHAIQQKAQIEEKVIIENSDFESKKKKLIESLDQYLLLLQQTMDYFMKYDADTKSKFVNADRVSRFYDNNVKLIFTYKLLISLTASIFKELPVNDDIYKKLKKRLDELKKMSGHYLDLFKPSIVAGKGKTNFVKGGVANVPADLVDDVGSKLYDLIDNMKSLVNNLQDMIQYLDSTPRSGKGLQFNIDTTEYIIPSKYL